MLSIPSAGHWGSSARLGEQQGVCPGPHPDFKKPILGYLHGELGSTSLPGLPGLLSPALQSQGVAKLRWSSAVSPGSAVLRRNS